MAAFSEITTLPHIAVQHAAITMALSAVIIACGLGYMGAPLPKDLVTNRQLRYSQGLMIAFLAATVASVFSSTVIVTALCVAAAAIFIRLQQHRRSRWMQRRLAITTTTTAACCGLLLAQSAGPLAFCLGTLLFAFQHTRYLRSLYCEFNIHYNMLREKAVDRSRHLTPPPARQPALSSPTRTGDKIRQAV